MHEYCHAWVTYTPSWFRVRLDQYVVDSYYHGTGPWSFPADALGLRGWNMLTFLSRVVGVKNISLLTLQEALHSTGLVEKRTFIAAMNDRKSDVPDVHSNKLYIDLKHAYVPGWKQIIEDAWPPLMHELATEISSRLDKGMLGDDWIGNVPKGYHYTPKMRRADYWKVYM